MADKITYISPEGLEKLQAELKYLKTVRRRELAERIDAAKSLGDLSENAEYHEAKDELAFAEGRVQQIQEMLKNVSLIESGQTGGVVRIGTAVEVEVNGKKKTYTIVGSNEADPVAGYISNESPLGETFLGHKVGDTVEVETPAGLTSYKIVSVA
ncbi:MAG: transcription elongation factor GreA [Patescibacteria group bacterium]